MYPKYVIFISLHLCGHVVVVHNKRGTGWNHPTLQSLKSEASPNTPTDFEDWLTPPSIPIPSMNSFVSISLERFCLPHRLTYFRFTVYQTRRYKETKKDIRCHSSFNLWTSSGIIRTTRVKETNTNQLPQMPLRS